MESPPLTTQRSYLFHLLRWTLFALAVLAWWHLPRHSGSTAWACFAVIAGRQATVDGSVLVGHNEQDSGVRMLNFSRVPAYQFSPGDTVKLRRGGTLPQVPQTLAYLWSQCPKEEFSDSFLNEKGVIVVSDKCPTREDPYEVLVARGEIRDGGIGLLLRRLVAQRAATAREGVCIAGELVERFGYVSDGRAYVIADPREAWLFCTAGGPRWVAQRVPDDQVVVMPNIHIIREVDLSDPDNFLASSDLVEYAIRRGWYDSASGRAFDFRVAYRKNRTDEVDPRRRHAHRLLLGDPEAGSDGPLPFGVVPKEKLTVASMAEILRDRSGEKHFSTPETVEAAVFQLRDRLPADIGCVYWRISCEPSSGVLVPWYCGVTEVPDVYFPNYPLETRLTPEYHFNPPPELFQTDGEFLFWKLRRVQEAVYADYDARIEDVRSRWREIENRVFANQPALEEEAMRLWKADPDAARAMLARYGQEVSDAVLAEADRLVREMTPLHLPQSHPTPTVRGSEYRFAQNARTAD